MSQSAPRQSVPQQSNDAHGHAEQSQELRGQGLRVTQEQMDKSGYKDAFSAILASIPDHIKDNPPAKSAEESLQKTDVDSQHPRDDADL